MRKMSLGNPRGKWKQSNLIYFEWVSYAYTLVVDSIIIFELHCGCWVVLCIVLWVDRILWVFMLRALIFMRICILRWCLCVIFVLTTGWYVIIDFAWEVLFYLFWAKRALHATLLLYLANMAHYDYVCIICELRWRICTVIYFMSQEGCLFLYILL